MVDLTLDYPRPNFLGGDPREAEKAKSVLMDMIHLYWEGCVRNDLCIAKMKPVCIALFREDNGPDNDPFDIVCRSAPPSYVRGYRALANELVPAWVLYLNRAIELTTIIEKAQERDNSR